ncbi:MAG TPA: sterol desaturase family protein [Candidatus Acidoferrales bacterium]|nr:sterol desaturase family protein [Candidatus Acidoferrales bacterium]
MRIKRNNLLAAVLSGSVLVGICIRYFPYSVYGILGGFVLGFFYANGFEYFLHRFVLHTGRGVFCQQHMLHHTTLNSPEAARYVNFSRNPWGVVALFFANAAPFLFLQWIFREGWTAGVFASFTIYYIAFEEIHWRSHMGGSLPKWLRPAARHHLLHHARDRDRFNVFLPIFDWLADRFRSHARISSDEPG